MFASLTNNLSKIFNKIINQGVLTEEAVDLAMREVRIALLEADVSLPVVRDFIERVRKEAVGEKVIKSIRPDQLVIKIVQDELIKLLGEGENDLRMNRGGLTVLMLVGLQGSGKTTTSAKLALKLKNNKKKVLLASLDTVRPAAQQQLEILAAKIMVDSLEIISGQTPELIAKRASEQAKRGSYDVLILDTAGRLHIDDQLMLELEAIKRVTSPSEILLVADAMTGQDAVNIAKRFNSKLNVTGVILTRLDGDTKGGAALSMKYVTSCPIKFSGVGERPEDFEEFQADRIAARILDKGDIVSFVEKAVDVFNQEESEKLANDIKKGNFNFNHLKDYLLKTKKFGGLSGILGMLPGINKIKEKMQEADFDDSVINRMIAIVDSMTKKERKWPNLLNASRKIRIAKGAGVTVQEVNKIMKMQLQMSKMMKKFSGMDKKTLLRGGIGNLFK
jgi:signal recognition particle subunit SRP54